MEYIDTSSIRFDLKIDCNWHAQLQGEVPNECMKIQVTAVSAQTDPIVELYALNSQSIPLEDHEGSWSQLIPTWRFVDEYENVVTRLSIHTRQHPIYTDIVTGEAKVKYIDDSPSEIGRPILLLATMSLTGYPLDKENIYSDKSDNVITHPGYSNSKLTKVHVMEINESTPNGLRVSRNGIEPMSAQSYWAGQFIPCVVTVEGWHPKAYNNGDIGNNDKHITIYNYPYDPDVTVPLTGFVYAQETGIPEYDTETSGAIYGGLFRRYTDDENKFRTGGYTVISAVPEFESMYTVISACARPEIHASRPWTMAKSWVAFPDTDTPSTIAYFYPSIDNDILNSEIIQLVNNPEALFNVDSIPYSFSVPIPNSIAGVVPDSDEMRENKNTGGTGVFAMDLACNTWIPDCELGTLTKINRNHEIVGKQINLMTDVNSVSGNISLPTPLENHLSPNNLWLSIDDKVVTTCFTDHIITIHDAITHEMIGCAYTPPSENTDNLYPEVNGKPMDSQERPVAAIIGYHGPHYQEDSTENTERPILVLYESFYKDPEHDRETCSLVQFDYAETTGVYVSSGPGYNIFSTGISATSSFDIPELDGQNVIDVTYYNEYMYVLSEDYTGTGNANFNNKGHLTIIPLLSGVNQIKVFSLLSSGNEILHPASICITDPNPEAATLDSEISIYFTGYTENNGIINAGVFKKNNISYKALNAGNLEVDRMELKTLEEDTERGNLGQYANDLRSYTDALNGLSIDCDNQIWLVDNRVGKLKVFHDLQKNPSEKSFPTINGIPVKGTTRGDWNGSRLMLNYFRWEFAPHIFYGESEPFIVDSYTNYKIRKHNDSWHVVDRMRYATDVAPFKENTNFFDRYIGAALGGERVHGSYSVARKLYERIANAVPNIHDVDECGMDELHSIGVSQDVPMDMFTPHYPEELKRLMDLFSVSHEKLWGDRCKCDSFYFEAPGQYNLKNIPEGEEDDYNPKRFCPICKHYHGTNLGPMISNTNDIKLDVNDHPPYVVRSRYNKRYIKIVPSIESIRDANDLLTMLETMTGDDHRKTPQYNALVQLLVRIGNEKQSRHDEKYENCPIWSSFLYRYGVVQTSQADTPENHISIEFNNYYDSLEEIDPLSSPYVPAIDEQLSFIYGEGSAMKEMENLKEWISMFQSPVTPSFDITHMPQSITRDLLILKFTIDNLSTYHDKLVAVHTSMFTPEPWYNYCIYHYIPTQCARLNTSVINWDDSMNSLSESVSGLDDWYQEDGIVENMLAYVMRKGLGFESANVGKYMIYFYPNDGTGSMEIQTIPRDVELALSECAFTKFGYRFIGWSTSPFGKVIYHDKQLVKNLLEEHQVITLYAQWEKLPCLTITFEPNGADGDSYTQEIPTRTSAELLPYAFEAAGSGFSGWALTDDGNPVLSDLEVVYNPFDVDTPSTLYAHWFTLTGSGRSINDIISYVNN